MTHIACHINTLQLPFVACTVPLTFTLPAAGCTLIGRNGIGKSLLLELLAGQRRADSGKIEWLTPSAGCPSLHRLKIMTAQPVWPTLSAGASRYGPLSASSRGAAPRTISSCWLIAGTCAAILPTCWQKQASDSIPMSRSAP